MFKSVVTDERLRQFVPVEQEEGTYVPAEEFDGLDDSLTNADFLRGYIERNYAPCRALVRIGDHYYDAVVFKPARVGEDDCCYVAADADGVPLAFAPGMFNGDAESVQGPTTQSPPTFRTAEGVAPGYHTVTPAVTVTDIDEAIDFYKRALGAEEILRLTDAGGKIIYAEIKIGDSLVMLSDEWERMKAPVSVGCATASFMIYVPDVDASYERAVMAGAKSTGRVHNEFTGDRSGQVTDPYGHTWVLSTQVENLNAAEMEQRAREILADSNAPERQLARGKLHSGKL